MPKKVKTKHFITFIICFLFSIILFGLDAYAAYQIADLVGVYNGTYNNNYGLNGMQLLIFQNGASYHAACYFYPVPDSPPEQRYGSFLCDINYNETSGKYEMMATSWIDDAGGSWVYMDIYGTFNNGHFSGNLNNDNDLSVSLNKIVKSEYLYYGNHNHMVNESYFEIETEASCTETGTKLFYCIFCGEMVNRESLPKLNHTPSGEWIITQEATCTEEGTRVQYCTVCGDVVLSESVPKLPHTPSGEWIVLSEATCTAEGGRVQYCTVCGDVAISEPIPRLPHTPSGEWVVTKEATCEATGTRVQYCTICGDIALSETLQKLPHTPSGEWVVLTEPLCSEPGRRVQYCLICGDIARDEIMPALTGLDHVFERNTVSGNIFIPPIVYEDECSVCGFTEQHTDWTYVWVSPAVIAGFLTFIITALKIRTGARKKKTFVCPYCFETHLVHEIQFRCANGNCENVDDVELTKYEGGNVSLPMKGKPTFAAPKSKNYSIPKNAPCPTCGRKTSKIICPSCHNNLPESTVVGKDMIISIVGSRDVGKSHFVGVIINELIERVAGKFNGSLTGFDDTMSRYEASFGRQLYVELTKLNLTQSSITNKSNGAYKPLIFTLSIKKGSKIRNYTLVFYDTAGEDLNEFDTMSTVNRYICKSAGIIFLLDPMQIWSVRNQLDDEIVSRASSVAVQQASRPDDIMTRVSKLIRNDKDMKSTKKISTPVAAVFSKFDAIVPIVPQDLNVLNPSPHCNEGAFMMSDWHNINTEIQNLLKTWGASAFTQQLEINYTNFSYFAVSALGLDNNPRSDKHIDRPRPHRIEDALLWILKENGVINSKN